MYYWILAALIISVLAGYAIYLQCKLRALDVSQQRAAGLRQQDAVARSERAHKSIEILARATVADELTVTEACMRIDYLMQQLHESHRFSLHRQVFTQVAEAAAHIPILDRWQALSAADKKRYTLERLRIEANYRDFVIAACHQLLDD